MASLTATILIYGAQHELDTPYLIELTENSRPALILHQFTPDTKPVVIIPTLEDMANDVLLMVGVYILKQVEPSVQLNKNQGQSLYDLLTEDERRALYTQSIKAIKDSSLSFIFTLLDGSHLLQQVEKLKSMPINIEITVSLK